MNRYIAFITILSAPLAASAQEPVETTAQQCEQVAEQLHRLAANATEALNEAAAIMEGVKTKEDTQAAAEDLNKALNALETFYALYSQADNKAKLAEEDHTGVKNAIIRVSQAWDTIASESADTLSCEELIYQLFVRPSLLSVCLFQTDDGRMEPWLSVSPIDQQRQVPGLREEQEAWRASAKKRHEAFMAEHQDILTGGNGADKESAICLPADMSQEAQRQIVMQYLDSVYARVDSRYMARQASPNGAFYRIFSLYKGMYRDADGQAHLRVLPVWFRVTPGK